ncbi:MAG: hypothetical protein BWY83_02873 [bacterium ADurb.Bin478]|nr:MAG: hypothetical protein BWY83_02873 [bacterium ADurb.Bin478]
MLLPAHIGKIFPVDARAGEELIHIHDKRGDVKLTVEKLHGLIERLYRDHPQVSRHGRLLGVLNRKQHTINLTLRRAHGDGQSAMNGTQTAVQTQLAQQDILLQPVRMDSFQRGQYADSHRQIKGSALFADIRRRQIDRDPFSRQIKAGVFDRCLHPLLGFANCAIRQSHSDETGIAAVQMRLYLDQIGVNTKHCAAENLSQHHS